MGLVLKPTIKDFSREELEEHLAGIRTRRMAIAFDYQIGEQLKLDQSRQRTERKYGDGIIKLSKELTALDRALEKVEKRMDELTQLKQQDDLLRDLIDNTQVEA